MGSSEKLNKSTTAIIASTSSPQSAAFQESPIFNYISNLSPIKPVKGTSAIQVLTALNSPLVFTSPQVHAHRHSIKLKSSQCQLSSRGEDDTAPSLKNSKDALPEMTDSMNPEGSMEIVDNEDDNVLAPPAVRNGSCLQSNICQNFVSNVTADQRVAQVGQNQLGKRRRLQFETAQENIVENDPPSSQTPSSTAAISEVLESSTSQNTRNSNVVNFSKKPSGIGLHLNSIVNAMPLSYPISGGKCPSFSSNSNLVEATREENAHQTPYTNAKTMKMIQYQENFHHSEAKEFDRPYPKKKRNKTDSSGDGCKRCNCKKTKCLKLYCDCFAAGIYCADSCSCQGCLNRPEYENTVLEKRQQIESRNPIAFAPKVVPRSTQPPRSQTEEDGDAVTAVTGRHKRGCNCKKSMCLKKYCECYQANVGCSDGCRCEGCQNIYGTKGVITEMGMESVNESLNDSFDDKKLKVGPIRLRSSLPHNLTPQTPSFQCSNHGNDASKACVFPGRYIPSPESECTFYPKSPNNSSSFDMMIEASNKNLEKVPFDELSYPNVEFMDEFSPGDWSRAQLLPPNGIRFSSLGFRGSSVITPVTLFGGSKPSFDIIDDDDTLKILKVASSSPNKKRVSPPRIGGVVGSSSLKSGRKFILKAVPSFPPLTPCIDSKQTSIPPPPDNITL